LLGGWWSRGKRAFHNEKAKVLAAWLSLLPWSLALAAHRKRFVFKTGTKDGDIVGNVVVEAKYKLRQRCPDREILEGHEK
jgi:hypothetical protein